MNDVKRLCDHWDYISKGPTTTTIKVREAARADLVDHLLVGVMAAALLVTIITVVL